MKGLVILLLGFAGAGAFLYFNPGGVAVQGLEAAGYLDEVWAAVGAQPEIDALEGEVEVLRSRLEGAEGSPIAEARAAARLVVMGNAEYPAVKLADGTRLESVRISGVDEVGGALKISARSGVSMVQIQTNVAFGALPDFWMEALGDR